MVGCKLLVALPTSKSVGMDCFFRFFGYHDFTSLFTEVVENGMMLGVDLCGNLLLQEVFSACSANQGFPSLAL
jgi:hypothetical protein